MLIGFSNIDLDSAVKQIQASTSQAGWTDHGRRRTEYRLLLSLFEYIESREDELIKLFNAGNQQISGTSKTDAWIELSDEIWTGGLLADIHELVPI